MGAGRGGESGVDPTLLERSYGSEKERERQPIGCPSERVVWDFA